MQSLWVPWGEAVTVAGKVLPGGMLYVGRSLSAPRCETDPALVNPGLRVDHTRPDHEGQSMGYWPSYSDISPQARGAYLSWLAGGRRNPDAYIGYVFLFFYGLERRLFVDKDACEPRERALLLAEIRRLNRLYGDNWSFAGYSSRLLAAVADPAGDWVGRQPPEAVTDDAFEMPVDLRVGLGQHIVAGAPIPADWALAWYRAHPDTRRLRTAATRCPDEFEAVFARIYGRDFGAGLRPRRPKRTIRTVYQPASAGIGDVVVFDSDLPDVASLTGPLNKLQALVEEATDALDAYSRYIGRNPAARGSAAALALLPDGVDGPSSAEAEALWSWASARVSADGNGVVATADLLGQWPTPIGKLAKSDMVSISRLLDKRGLGIEPDVRFGATPPSSNGRVVLFRRGTEHTDTLSIEYELAQAVVNLGVAVALADGTVSEPERRALRDHVTSAFLLSDDEQRRLDAHAALIMANPPTPASLKRKLAAVSAEDRAGVANLLTDIAASDGDVSVHEIRTLERLFTALGMGPGDVYAYLHGKATTDPEPVALRTAGAPATRVPLPSRSEPGAVKVGLDPEVLARKRAESQRVAVHLAEIFADDQQAPEPTSAPDPNLAASIGGLDGSHSAFFAVLDTRDQWDRGELEVTAKELGLLLDGALDTINEAAFDAADAPFWENDDPILINHDVAEELRS